MKLAALILLSLCVFSGCTRQAPKPSEVKYETLTLKWASELPDAGMTNHCVIIRTVTATSTNVDQTDVESLDRAGNILGQYGWSLVTTETKDGAAVWHMQRQARDDGKTFMLELYNPQWNSKP